MHVSSTVAADAVVRARRPRGRPKGTGKIDPDSIVEAALDALADGGYGALSMRGVARSLGISLATLQHHHATKDDLWRAAVDHLTAEVFQRNADVDPTDLVGKVEAFLRQGAARPGLLASLLSDRAPGAPERLNYLAGRFTITFTLTDQRLHELHEAGFARNVDHRALLALMTIGIGSIAGAAGAVDTIYGFDLDDDDDRHALAVALADIIGLGILRR